MSKILILLSILLSSCTAINPTRRYQVKKKRTVSATRQEKQNLAKLLEKEAVNTSFDKFVKENSFKAPSRSYQKSSIRKFSLNYPPKLYKFWLKYFTKRDKARFRRHVQNGLSYKSLVFKILKEQGLPTDLYYVGLIESGYNAKIRSHADAVGPWQFIKGTATRYGLKVNRVLDERTNIYKATVAASKYFKDLYNIFGSWELALCAYNAGEYRIINAIRKGNTRDYKTLVKKGLLPKETIYYVPKVAAAKRIESNLNYYGFHNIRPKTYEFKNVVYKNIPRDINLYKIARDNKIGLRKLRKLNPDFKVEKFRGFRYSKTGIILPRDGIAKAYGVKRYIASKKVSTKAESYKVRKGDTLISISRKSGTSLRELLRYNKLSLRSVIKVGQVLSLKKESKRKSNKLYVVRKGDNLYKIARKFGVTVSMIKKKNRLRGPKIILGQRLKI